MLDRLHAGKWACHDFKQTKFYTHCCEMCKELRANCVRGKDGALIQASYKMSFAIYSKLLDYWNWKYEQNSIYNSLIEFLKSTSIYLCHCLRRTGGETVDSISKSWMSPLIHHECKTHHKNHNSKNITLHLHISTNFTAAQEHCSFPFSISVV